MSRKSTFVKDAVELITMLEKEFNPKKWNKKPGIDKLEALRTVLENYSQKKTIKTNLIFNSININSIKIPDSTLKEINNISLELRIKICEEDSGTETIKDCIIQSIDSRIEYSVQLIAKANIPLTKVKYKMAWHLDKHIRSNTLSDGVGKGFIHPEYHFSVGGHEVTKDQDVNFGTLLLLDTPRFMHPPLGIILSIDFVLRYFYGSRHLNFLSSKKYNKITQRAKIRLWRPYFLALAHHFDDSTRFSDLDIEKNYASKLLGEH